MGRFTRSAIGLMVGASILLSGSTAFALLDKCQATLEKNGLKLMIAANKALTKCEDTIRKGVLKGDPAHKAAVGCEKALAAVLGVSGGVPAAPLPEKTKIGKFIAAVAKADGKGTCNEADLFALGHLISGISAPGTRGPTCTDAITPCTNDSMCPAGFSCPGSSNWAQYWLVWAKLKLAWLEQIFEVGDTTALLDVAIEAGPDAVPACDPATGKGCGTDCTGAPPANHVFRPNLCNFSALKFPQCRIHSCNLSAAAGASIQPLGLPVGLSNKKLTLQLCKPLTGTPAVAGVATTFRPVIGDPGRGFQPPAVVPISGGIRVCIDQVRSQGWCDCGGGGVPFEPTACQDHVQNDNVGTDDCGDAVGTTGEPDCVCGAPAAATCAAPCVACVNSEDGSRCHPGTVNGSPVPTIAGASVVGSCSVFNTISLKLVPQGICLNAMLQPIGTCTTGGPGPDAGCAATPPIAGGPGVACADADGADGVTCTADDLIPPAAATSIPFTTGTSTSLVADAVAVQGSCSGTMMNCATDADCTSPETCGGETLTTLSFSAGPGSGISCAAMEASQLAGWNIVGSFPALDGAGGLNDTVTTFSLACE